MSRLGENIDLLLREKGLTQQELADKVKGLSQPVLQKMISRNSGSSKFAPLIASSFRVNLNWLLTGEGNKNTVIASISPAIEHDTAFPFSPPSYEETLNPKAVEFALFGLSLITQDAKDDEGEEWLASIFIKLYKSRFNDKLKDLDAPTILELVS